MKKLLVTGAAGHIGRQIIQTLGRDYEVVATDLVASEGAAIQVLDLLDEKRTEAFVRGVQPDLILHLANNKNVFACEKDPEGTHRINYEVTVSLARLSQNLGSHFFFISSDYVFPGQDPTAFYSEASPTEPSTQYGRDKAQSEDYLRENLDYYSIVRSSGIYGYGGDYVATVAAALQKGEKFAAFTDLVNNPTHIGDFLAMLQLLLAAPRVGTFHASGAESVSRYEFATLIARHFGLNADLLQPTNLPPGDIRPRYLRLKSDWTYRQLGYTPKNLR